VRNATRAGFTLIELLVVIGIIAILMGLLFSVGPGVLDRTEKVQAKNDLTQIVTAVNAFYTEYGRYPNPTADTTDAAATYGGGKSSKVIFDELRGAAPINIRQIQFISPPEDKSQLTAKGKIGGDGQFYDPWGTPYSIAIDANYNNVVTAPAYSDLKASYTTDGGDTGVRTGVIAWALGKDKQLGNKGDNKFTGSDDVISWQ